MKRQTPFKICVAENKERENYPQNNHKHRRRLCDNLWCWKGSENMKKNLLTNGKAFKRTDNRWGGTVWYMDEQGERKRESFSGTTKAEVNKKMTAYIAEFNQQLTESDESRKTLRESMTHWLQVFKLSSVKRGTYDRCECTAKHQICPLIGEKVVGDITSADLKSVLKH